MQLDAREILACILDELCGNFILALDLMQVKTRVTIDCFSCHQSIDNQDSFIIFQHPVANTVQSSLDLFLTPEHLSGDNSFCNYCSSLQPAIIEHGFSRVRQFLIIQLRRFVNFHGIVTKGINIVKGALQGLRQFLTSESHLKIMKNTFYFTLKGLFVLKIFKFLS